MDSIRVTAKTVEDAITEASISLGQTLTISSIQSLIRVPADFSVLGEERQSLRQRRNSQMKI